jgi:hypothetical protein
MKKYININISIKFYIISVEIHREQKKKKHYFISDRVIYSHCGRKSESRKKTK